jgi:hypothetical protein
MPIDTSYVSGTGGPTVVSTISTITGTTFQACMDACDADCAFINYDYDSGNCTVVRPDQTAP